MEKPIFGILRYSRINYYHQHCLNIYHHLSYCCLVYNVFHFGVDLFSECYRSLLFLPIKEKCIFTIIVIAHVI